MNRKLFALLLLLILVCWIGICFGDDYPLEIVIQMGHSSPVHSVCYSPDGKYIVTGSDDYTAKLWETATGRVIRTFKGHSNLIYSVSFSPSGRYIVTGSVDNTAKIWDIASGHEIKTFKGHSNYINSVSFSPDGKYIISGSDDHSARLWDVDTGYEIQIFEGHLKGIGSVNFSPDGKYIVTGSDDNTAKLWEIYSGREIRSFKGHSNHIRSVSFSPDGNYIITGSRDNTAKLWNVNTSKELRTFTDHKDYIQSVNFSPDGKYIITGSGDGTAKLWDVVGGNEIRTFKGNGTIMSTAFSPDSKHIALVSWWDYTTKLWEIASGQEHQTFKGYIGSTHLVSFSPDGKYFVTGYWTSFWNAIKLWEVSSGHEFRTFGGHSGDFRFISFSPNCYYIATCGYQDIIANLWTRATGHNIQIFKGHSKSITAISFSPDGRYIVTSSYDSTAKLWDIATGNEIRTFQGHSDRLSYVSYNPVKNYLATGSEDRTTKLWDIDTGNEIRTFQGHSDKINSLCFSLDGAYLFTGSSDNTAKLWNVETGAEIRTFKGHLEDIISVNISPDGKYVITGSLDKTAKLWEVDTGRNQYTYKGHTGGITSLCFSPNGKYFVTGSRDANCKFWKLNSENEIATFMPIGEKDWIIVTPQGFFDCSEGAEKYIHFVKGTAVYELDQFFEDFYRPGLLAEVMSGKELKRPDLNVAEQLTQSPPPTVEIVSPKVGDTFTQKEIEIVVKIIDTGGGIDEAVLLHNNKRVPDDTRGFQIANDDQNSVTKKYIVNLLEGENVFRASAFSKGRIESRGYELTVFFKGVTATANSYVFVIGIDQYKNTKYNLNYAYADAAGVKDLIVNKSAKLFRNTFIHELYNSDANSNNIKSIFNQIMPKIQPQDVFTFFYAGHGVMVPDKNGKEQFYLIPTEITSLYDEEKVHQSGISGKQLVQFSSQIAARKQLFIIDACQAGGISDDFAMNRGFAEEKALAQLARSAGIHVIASSQSDQYASEFSELGHGLFTYALIQAMNGKAEAPPPDGKITIREVNVYLENVIPDLARKYKGQAQYPVIYSKGQDFPVVVE